SRCWPPTSPGTSLAPRCSSTAARPTLPTSRMAAEPQGQALSAAAPGNRGIDPTVCSSAKDMVSTALGPRRLPPTFGYGIVDEAYWPSTGQPQRRDLGFSLAGPNGWTEVTRARHYPIAAPRGPLPLPQFVHEGDGYRLELECLTH